MGALAAQWELTWTPELARAVSDLRAEALRLVVRLVAVGYLGWHFLSLIADSVGERSFDRALRLWLLALVVGAGLAMTGALLRRGSPLATGWFLGSAFLATTAAIWLLAAPQATLIYALLALAAAVLVGPPAGLGLGLGALGLLLLLRAAGPLAFLDGDRLAETGVAVVAAVTAAWALGQPLVTAVAWSSRSSAEAKRNAEEARANRAELVRALKQLDQAYYRLQRANAALELAWQAADAAQRSKSEFVTTISHELRTPLNLIAGFSELILTAPEGYGESLPAAYRGDLNTIYRNAQHLLTLTNDIIDLARVGMGRLTLVREPVDLAQTVAEAAEVVRAYVEAKGLRLRLDLQSGLLPVSLDRLRIRQVLLNLLTNAARFAERGSITVTARQDGDEVLIRVADTGAGIAPEDLPAVFTEFFHGGEAGGHPREALGGVGLGLPLSRRFVELHGGRMGVDSWPGVGTTFWFTLPLAPGAAESPSGSWPGSRPASRGGAERIVVLAGADGQLAAFLQRHLTGHRVVVAPDLPAAIEVAITERALAILADLEAGTPTPAATPVPLLRLPLPHGERLATALGASDHLVKPITGTRLRAALARLKLPVHTVLIVDDDPSFVRLLTRLLQTAGPPVARDILTAHTGHEALALLEGRRPDLVLLDLVMPTLDGQATLAAMRAQPTLADVPVILISGQDQLAARLPLRGELAVVKPDGFGLEELLDTIEAILRSLAPPRAYLAARPGGAPAG